ncbi:MAG: hypothetical protein ACAH27_06085 [Xanthobacteraceae bacterium]
MSKYTYFGHVKRHEYRIVIESGRPLPDGLDAADWRAEEERPFDAVHKEVMRDIEAQGFGAYRQYIRPGDVPTN